MMPSIALLGLFTPGMIVAQEVAASGVATDLIAFIVNTILYAGIILCGDNFHLSNRCQSIAKITERFVFGLN